MSNPWKEPEPLTREIEIERDIPCRMRDGVTLLSDIYRPKAEGIWPVLLMRHPYDKTQAENISYAHPIWYARYGYIVVIQDCRGRWKSEGSWYPFLSEEQDGVDTLAWASKLRGCNGMVGMYGLSYAGATQLLAAIHQPPGLATIIPAMTGSDYYDGWTYRGGALHHAFTQSWATQLAIDTAHRMGDYALEGVAARALVNAMCNYWLPFQLHPVLSQQGLASYYYDWIEYETYDDYWKQWSIRRRYERIKLPALHIAGWYDVFLEGTLENFSGLQQRAGSDHARRIQKLVIGPWYHMPWQQQVGSVDFGENARNCIDALQVLWLNKQLKGESNQLDTEPPVALFIMGENKWRLENEWPPKQASQVKYYLHSKGRANSLNGNGYLNTLPPTNEYPDVYTYDPTNPVMSLGGHSCCFETLAPMGPCDQRPQEYRNDVLVYSTDVLTVDTEVIGTVELTLYAASTAVDTDFTVKLVNVHPDGKALNLTEGIVRARFRESLEKPSPIIPNKVYEYKILVGSTANLFKAGHRIRLEISSSNFPCFDRNNNSGSTLAQANVADNFVATQTVFHDNRYPSHAILPVVQRE